MRPLCPRTTTISWQPASRILLIVCSSNDLPATGSRHLGRNFVNAPIREPRPAAIIIPSIVKDSQELVATPILRSTSPVEVGILNRPSVVKLSVKINKLCLSSLITDTTFFESIWRSSLMTINHHGPLTTTVMELVNWI